MQKFEAAVAVGFSHAQIDPQVETLDDAAVVVLACLEIVHQQLLVVAKGADEFLHRVELAAHRAGAPFAQIPPRPVRAVVLPKGVKGFL